MSGSSSVWSVCDQLGWEFYECVDVGRFCFELMVHVCGQRLEWCDGYGCGVVVGQLLLVDYLFVVEHGWVDDFVDIYFGVLRFDEDCVVVVVVG